MWVRIIKLSFTPSFELNWGLPISPNKKKILLKKKHASRCDVGYNNIAKFHT
jgi:hypothetical protein